MKRVSLVVSAFMIFLLFMLLCVFHFMSGLGKSY